MNIFEPNTKMNYNKKIIGIDYTKKTQFKEGHLHIDNPKSKYGKFIIKESPSPKDYLSVSFIKTYRQIYITRRKKQQKGEILFYIDYFSRHGHYVKEIPLCGKRSLGGIVVKYEILNNGIIEKSEKFLNPSKCKKDVDDGLLKPSNKDGKLIPIERITI